MTCANEFEHEASKARIYIGDKLVGTLPDNVKKGKLYTFEKCDADGNFVKIVTGRNDSD